MINKMFFKQFSTHPIRGFTLIETLVAVLLLVTAIAGPLTLASRSLLAASTARDQIIAYYLAQDAIEYVRFARDTNKLNGFDWVAGGSGGVALTPCLDAKGCYLDSTGNSPAFPTLCNGSGGACPVINYDSSAGRYTYSGGTATPFTRKVQISPVVAGEEQTVTVTVTWRKPNGSTSNPVTIQENVFNWQ